MQGIFAPTNITTINFLAPVVIPDPGTYLDLNTQAESNTVLGPGLSGQTVGAPVVTAYIVEDTQSMRCSVLIPALPAAQTGPGAAWCWKGSSCSPALAMSCFGHETRPQSRSSPRRHAQQSNAAKYRRETTTKLNAPGQIGTVNASPLILNGPVGGIVNHPDRTVGRCFCSGALHGDPDGVGNRPDAGAQTKTAEGVAEYRGKRNSNRPMNPGHHEVGPGFFMATRRGRLTP